jgi:hypothetical protein
MERKPKSINKQTIINVVYGLFIILFIYLFFKVDNYYNTTLNNSDIEKIKNELVILKQNHANLVTKRDSIKNEILQDKQSILSLEEKIKQIEKNEKDKTNIIDNSTDLELQEFFTKYTY